MFPDCRLTMTSRQLIGNTPCPASTHRPDHLGSSGQQGPSWVTHSLQPWPRRPGSVLYRFVHFYAMDKSNHRLDGLSITSKGSCFPSCPQGKRHRGSEFHLSVNLCWKIPYPPWQGSRGKDGTRWVRKGLYMGDGNSLENLSLVRLLFWTWTLSGKVTTQHLFHGHELVVRLFK